MNIKKKVENVKETVKDKKIPKELYDKIMSHWNQLPAWRKLPTIGNQRKFFKELNLNKDEQRLFLDLIKKK